MGQALVGMEVRDLREALGGREPAYRARQLYEAIYRQYATGLDSVTTFPKALRERVETEFDLGLPEQAARYDSVDGTRRYLLRLSDGRTVETVLMPEGDRKTLCISSQV